MTQAVCNYFASQCVQPVGLNSVAEGKEKKVYLENGASIKRWFYVFV